MADLQQKGEICMIGHHTKTTQKFIVFACLGIAGAFAQHGYLLGMFLMIAAALVTVMEYADKK